jgi:hypothetical protein
MGNQIAEAATSFTLPAFSWLAVLYVSVGAALLWAKLGAEARKIFVLEDLLSSTGMSQGVCTSLGLVIFVSLGCLVAIGTVDPKTPMQAVVAGMGWTGMLSTTKGAG